MSSSKTDIFDFGTIDEKEFLSQLKQELSDDGINSNENIIQNFKKLANLLEDCSQEDQFKKQEYLELCNIIVSHRYLTHSNKDIRIYLSYILGQILRIFAPKPPFDDPKIKDVMECLICLFEQLEMPKSAFFKYAFKTLEQMKEIRYFLLLLDNEEASDTIIRLIRILFTSINAKNNDIIYNSIQEIISCIISEADEVSDKYIQIILRFLTNTKNTAAQNLSKDILMTNKEILSAKLQSYLIGMISKWLPSSQQTNTDNCSIILEQLYKIIPDLMLPVLPHLSEMMQSPKDENRMKAAEISSYLLSNANLSEDDFNMMFNAYIFRFRDIKMEIRQSTLKTALQILKSQDSDEIKNKIYKECIERILDIEEKVRSEAIVSSCDILSAYPEIQDDYAYEALFSRLRDKKLSVRKIASKAILSLVSTFAKIFIKGEMEDKCDKIFKLFGMFFEILLSDPELKPFFLSILMQKVKFMSDLSTEELAKIWMRIYNCFTKQHQLSFLQILRIKGIFQANITEFLECREKLRSSASKSEEVLENEYSKQLDKYLEIISNLCSDKTKSYEYLKRISSIKDNNLFKVLERYSGVSSTLENCEMVKKDIINSLGASRGALWDFMKSISIMACPNIISPDIIQELLKDMNNELFLKHCAKSCPTIFSTLFEEITSKLDFDENAKLQLNLYILSKSATYMKKTNLISEEKLNKTIEYLKEISTQSQNPKICKYALLALHCLNPEHQSKQEFSSIFNILNCELSNPDISSNPRALAFIHSFSTAARIHLDLFSDLILDFGKFVMENFLYHEFSQNERIAYKHIPLRYNSRLDNDFPLDIEVVVKCEALKSLAKCCIPLDIFTKIIPNNFILLVEAIIQHIENLQYLNPYSDLSKITKKLIKFESEASSNEEDNDFYDVNHGCFRFAASVCLIRLSRRHESIINNRLYEDLALMAQDIVMDIRKEICVILRKHIYYLKRYSHNNRYAKYAAIYALSAIDPAEENRESSREYLLEYISNQYKIAKGKIEQDLNSNFFEDKSNVHYFPEFIIPYLIHILAHHDDFPDVQILKNEQQMGLFDTFQEMLIFVLKPLLMDPSHAPGENYPLIKKILQSIKITHDAKDVSIDHKMYTLCDIGMKIINGIINEMLNAKFTNIDNNIFIRIYPDTISLPKALFTFDERLKCVTEDGSHLPNNFKLISLDIGEKPKGKRGRKPGTGTKKMKASSIDNLSSSDSKENKTSIENHKTPDIKIIDKRMSDEKSNEDENHIEINLEEGMRNPLYEDIVNEENEQQKNKRVRRGRPPKFQNKKARKIERPKQDK